VDPEQDKSLLVHSLRSLAAGERAFEEAESLALEIRDRWSERSGVDLPPESNAETPLWCAVWDITASCRESLVDATGNNHPVLQHIAYLEGSRPLPDGWTGTRP